MVSSLSSGLSGMYSAQAKASDAAQRIASSASEGAAPDLTRAIVDLKSAEIEAISAAEVLSNHYKMTGILLDIEV